MSKSDSLTIQDVDCVRGERTLFRRLAYRVPSQQCLHVIGANGSGKTSLLRIIAGLSSAEAGNVLWNEKTIINNTKYLNDSAFIGHKDALKNGLTAIENLRFYQQLDNAVKGKQDKEKQLDDCLNKLKILHCADLLALQLSFGQRRRLAFAKLLLKPYKLWILDEPFTGIDADGRQIIEALCIEHLDAGGMIILTHHQSLQESVLQDYLSELYLESEAKPHAENQPESPKQAK